VVALAVYRGSSVKRLFEVIHIWNFYCTMSRDYFFSRRYYSNDIITSPAARWCTDSVKLWDLNSNFPGLGWHGIRPRCWKVMDCHGK